MQKDLAQDDKRHKLREWLEKVYDNGKHADFTSKEIAALARLIGRILKFEPSLRTTASDALIDSWFEQG